MFKFDLPKWAVLDVTMPTGTVQRLLHIGNGEFLAELPPILMAGLKPEGAEVEAADLPVAWDSDVIPWRSSVQPQSFLFDSHAAMASLKAAEARGDESAITLLQRMKQAEVQIEHLNAAPGQ